MLDRLKTRQELTSTEEFEKLMIDLTEYLKDTLVAYKDQQGQVLYRCTKYSYSEGEEYMEPFERVANFCIERNLDPHEVINMIEEYTGEYYNCECYWLRDEKIRKLIER